MFEKIETLLLKNVWAHQRFCHSAIFAVFDGCYVLVIGLIACNELKGAQINCLLWVKSYANEQKCKQ